jgi:hypothetical protein
MASGGPTASLRPLLEEPLAQFSSRVETLFEQARGIALQELAEQLNQAVRRIRLADSIDELGATLVDAAGAFADGAALFRVQPSDEAPGERIACGDRIRGISEEATQAFGSLQIPLASAAALAGAVETCDPVTAAVSPAEISPELMALLEHPPESRVHIFPLVVEEKVPALLYVWGSVQGAVVELLAQVAAAEWVLPTPVAPPVIELVTIAPAPDPDPPEIAAPDAVLSDEEERMHLRARRFARVQVAEMRLQDAVAVQAGRAQGDLYNALRDRIDAARTIFQDLYCAPCPSMVDYFHKELVRTLSHDDAELLGKDYPGPLA